jgi:hypothetical protein
LKIHVHTCMYIYIYLYIYLYIYMYVCMYACVYVCVCVCIYIYIYIVYTSAPLAVVLNRALEQFILFSGLSIFYPWWSSSRFPSPQSGTSQPPGTQSTLCFLGAEPPVGAGGADCTAVHPPRTTPGVATHIVHYRALQCGCRCSVFLY